MATLKSNSLTTLINMGPDSFTNLFKIHISNESFKDVILRTTKVTIPSKSRKSVDLPFHNTKASIGTPFFKYSHQFSFTLRVDAYYEAYALLKSCIGATSLDSPSKRGANIGTVTVEQLGTNEAPIYTWKFSNCEVLSVGDSQTLDFNSSAPVTVGVTIQFDVMTETQYAWASYYSLSSKAQETPEVPSESSSRVPLYNASDYNVEGLGWEDIKPENFRKKVRDTMKPDLDVSFDVEDYRRDIKTEWNVNATDRYLKSDEYRGFFKSDTPASKEVLESYLSDEKWANLNAARKVKNEFIEEKEASARHEETE